MTYQDCKGRWHGPDHKYIKTPKMGASVMLSAAIAGSVAKNATSTVTQSKQTTRYQKEMNKHEMEMLNAKNQQQKDLAEMAFEQSKIKYEESLEKDKLAHEREMEKIAIENAEKDKDRAREDAKYEEEQLRKREEEKKKAEEAEAKKAKQKSPPKIGMGMNNKKVGGHIIRTEEDMRRFDNFMTLMHKAYEKKHGVVKKLPPELFEKLIHIYDKKYGR